MATPSDVVLEPPYGEDRRKTRIVFPSSKHARIWKVIATAITAWATWMTAHVSAQSAQNNCTPVIIRAESLERVSK